MILQQFVFPGLRLLPEKMDSPEVRVLMVAIGLQESRFQDRYQLPGGPGRSFWHFDEIAIARILTHPSTVAFTRQVCNFLRIKHCTSSCYISIAYNDALASVFARLNLWIEENFISDPVDLPLLGQVDKAWSYYIRVWNPEKPRPELWDEFYSQAVRIVKRSY